MPKLVGAEPEAASIEDRGLGWKKQIWHGQRGLMRSPAGPKSSGPRRRRSGTNNFFTNLFGYEWELTKSPGPMRISGKTEEWFRRRYGCRILMIRPKRHAPSMLTTDLALRIRPSLRKDLEGTSSRNPDQFRKTRSPGRGSS